MGSSIQQKKTEEKNELLNKTNERRSIHKKSTQLLNYRSLTNIGCDGVLRDCILLSNFQIKS